MVCYLHFASYLKHNNKNKRQKISLNTLKSSRSERKIIGLTRVKVRPSVDYLPYMSSSVFIPQDCEKSLSTFSALGTFLMRILSFKYIYRDFYTAIRFLKTKIRYLLSIACNKFHNLLPFSTNPRAKMSGL